MNSKDLITIIGPTASGKTKLACLLANELDTEIISADSRQIYRNMDIGTGKDLNEYIVDGKPIKYHLIDIRDAGYKYNIFEYQQDFHNAFEQITSNRKLPILCGGSGLYIESVLKGYNLISVPENRILREQLTSKTLDQLKHILASYKTLHNITDVQTHKRAIRAIEIEEYKQDHPTCSVHFPALNSLIIGIDIDRDIRRYKISQRLDYRLKNGLIDEVRSLLDNELSAQDLIYYGLEYKFVTHYLLGQLSYQDMFNNLEIAIHQFAKRQMTWFRGMEKRGLKIHWIDYEINNNKKISEIKTLLNTHNFYK